MAVASFRHQFVQKQLCPPIACSVVQLETSSVKVSFNQKLESAARFQDRIKISQFIKFEVLSLNCNHVKA